MGRAAFSLRNSLYVLFYTCCFGICCFQLTVSVFTASMFIASVFTVSVFTVLCLLLLRLLFLCSGFFCICRFRKCQMNRFDSVLIHLLYDQPYTVSRCNRFPFGGQMVEHFNDQASDRIIIIGRE